MNTNLHNLTRLTTAAPQALPALGLAPEHITSLQSGLAAWHDTRGEAAHRLAATPRTPPLRSWLDAHELTSFWSAIRPTGHEPFLRRWLTHALPPDPGPPLAWSNALRSGAGRGNPRLPRVEPPEAVQLLLPMVADLVDYRLVQGVARELCARVPAVQGDEALRELLEETVANLRTAEAVSTLRRDLGEGEWAALRAWAVAQVRALGFDEISAEALGAWPLT